MARHKRGRSGILLGLAILNCVAGRKINTTIYDTNTAHITYTPQRDFCVRWSSHLFWRTCDAWAKAWQSEVYRSQGKQVTLHRSLDHEQPAMTIKFQGSAIWLYGPPRSQLLGVPVDHKVCLHQNHRVATDIACYRIDVAEAYSASEAYDAPVVIFAKGGLSDQEHQLVVSVGDPVDEVDKHQGIQFSHAVYTIERPTPWPTNEDSWRFRKVVMHDTHPLLSYSPKEPVSSGWWPWSPDSDGWFSKTYTAEDGSRVSWHELQSRGESNRDEWGIDATITAGVVAIYGIPKAHVGTDSLSDICVQIDLGSCEIVDVEHAYMSSEHHHEAVLLWQTQALDSNRQTRISVRLVKASGNELKVFPFKAIHYFEQQEYSSPDPPMGQLENVAVAHDDKAIIYHPERRCVNYFSWWCTEWFDAWTSKEAGPNGASLSYRSTVSAYRTKEDPSITLDFQGSSVYVYGAPRAFLKNGFASQQVCINGDCHIVDVEQAYLNAPESSAESTNVHSLQPVDTGNVTTSSGTHPELDSVLIWSRSGLDDKVQHSLRLALAEHPSEDKAEMSIVKVVYTKITYGPGQSRPDTPVPQPDCDYDGPSYPPHATKWAPRPAFPTPSPQHPLPAPSTPAHPPRQNPSIWPYIVWPVLGMLGFSSLCLCCVTCDSPTGDERRPIRPWTPPPPYVPQPAPPRPAPPRPRPNPPPVRPNPPPQLKPSPQPKPAPQPKPSSFAPKPPVVSPKQSTHPNPAGPSYVHHSTNNYRSSKPTPRSDLGFVAAQRTPVLPNPPIKPEATKPLPEDRNNPGPFPGSSTAPSKPAYNDQKQALAPSSSQKASHSSINTPTQAQSVRTPSLAPSRNIASPAPDYHSNRPTSQAVSPSAFTPAVSSTSSAVRGIASSSRVRVGNTAPQPPPVVRPTPQVPPKPVRTSSTTSATPATHRTHTMNRSSEPVIQPAPITTTPSAPINPPVVPNPSRRPAPQQTEHQSSATTSRSELPAQENTITLDPDIAQWAQSQGYRIDRLMNAATSNDPTRQRTRPRRNLGQTRNAMLPSDPTAHDTPDQGSAYWREWQRTFKETGQLLPTTLRVNQSVMPDNRMEQGGRQPEGSHEVVPAGGGAGMSAIDNRARVGNSHVRPGEEGAEAPAVPGGRRPRTRGRRPNQVRNNNGQQG